jgi:hypothetical protein
MERWRRAEAPVPRSDVSFPLNQKTANFNVVFSSRERVFSSREMQWSFLTEEKQKNQLTQTEFRVIKPIIKIRAGVITPRPLPPHQHCTAAKDGKFQGVHFQQTDEVECNH